MTISVNPRKWYSKENDMIIDDLHRMWDAKNAGTRKHPSDHEHHLQVACVRWFRMQYPQHLIYAIPNGGQRNAIVAAKLKAEGVTAGIPDLHIPVSRHGYHSLYIEMKNGKAGRLSEHQKECIAQLQSQGHKVAVCRTFDDFQQEIDAYLT